MALIRDIIFKARPTLAWYIQQETKIASLKAVKKVSIAFDPFREDVQSIREFTHLLYDQEILRTNQKCIIKTNILSDRSEQNIVFDLTDGKQIIIKCSKLTTLEIFKLFNEHITSLAPRDVPSVQKVTPEKAKFRRK